MKRIILLFFVIFLLYGCTPKTINIPQNSTTELLHEYSTQINSEDSAKTLFQLWLNSDTDFNAVSNKIESVDQYSGYYVLQLTTAVNISGRESGVLGYRDYKLTSDGKIYGYYYSK
jgi:hypothetical protein